MPPELHVGFDSESEKVQDIQSDYLVSLWNAGVRAFRMDAVKHINTSSMKAIKGEVRAEDRQECG